MTYYATEIPPEYNDINLIEEGLNYIHKHYEVIYENDEQIVWLNEKKVSGITFDWLEEKTLDENWQDIIDTWEDEPYNLDEIFIKYFKKYGPLND